MRSEKKPVKALNILANGIAAATETRVGGGAAGLMITRGTAGVAAVRVMVMIAILILARVTIVALRGDAAPGRGRILFRLRRGGETEAC